MTEALRSERGYIQPVQVHFDDLDAMGIVHNSRYALLLERAITAFWLDHGWSFDAALSRFPDVRLVVREFAITYHVPIMAAGQATVQFWLDKLGRTSVNYGFRVLSADRSVVHAEGRRVQVNLDPLTNRPAPLSEPLRAACAPLLEQIAC